MCVFDFECVCVCVCLIQSGVIGFQIEHVILLLQPVS